MAVRYSVMESVRVQEIVRKFFTTKAQELGIPRAMLIRDVLLDAVANLEKGVLPKRTKTRMKIESIGLNDDDQEEDGSCYGKVTASMTA